MLRIEWWVVVLWIPVVHVMSGCAWILGIEDLPDVPADAAPGGEHSEPRMMDADVTAPDAGRSDASPSDPCESWTPRPTHFDPCDLPAPLGALNLDLPGEYVYDTDQATLRNPLGIEIAHASRELAGNPPVRAISVDGLLVAGESRLRAVGSKPLLVASWSDIAVEGLIDVSSGLQNGAGANTGECSQAGEGEQDNDGGGGGGGGGLHGHGGQGGNGSERSNGGDRGGIVDTPDTVRGGCPGAPGGIGDDEDGHGAGGAGGGALQLTARLRIDIRGRLHAGGAGGGGANGPQGTRSGGGGGGSGGLLDLEAPVLTFGINAVVAANGGGGGEGTQGASAHAGSSGQLSAGRAMGGSRGSMEGGDGGDGSAGTDRDGTDGIDGIRLFVDRGGGGGGGGGAGYIIIDGEDTVSSGAVLSPPSVTR